MRRKDREISDRAEIVRILEENAVCRLAMVDDGAPYLVPLSYGYELEGDRLTLYFHCAREGRKLDVLRRSPRVCFEIEGRTALKEAAQACGYGFAYESLIGNGTAALATTHEEKAHALQRIMLRQAKKSFEFTEKQTASVAVLIVQADDYTAKACR